MTQPLDLAELAKLANDRIQFVKDTELDFHAGGDTRLAEGVLRLLTECESLRAEHNEVLALKAEVERLNGRLTNVSRQYAESHQAYLDSVEDGAKDLKDMRKFQMRFIAADRLLKLAEKALEHYGSKLASTGQIAREALAKIRQAKG